VGTPRSWGSTGQCREHMTLVKEGKESPFPLAGLAKLGRGCQPGVLGPPLSRRTTHWGYKDPEPERAVTWIPKPESSDLKAEPALDASVSLSWSDSLERV